jgi:hypothetical protein
MLTMLRITQEETSRGRGSGSLRIPASPSSQCRLASGRSALLHMIGRLPPEHCRTVLLPCYIAEGVIQPFLQAGFRLLFYRLRTDLTPMVEDIESLLERTPAAPVVVVVHYFGFPARSAMLEATLSHYGAVVVEDFAHAPFAVTDSGVPLAESAQIALFSLNKFLPVTDGAVLISNRADIDLSLNDDTLAELSDPVQTAYAEHLRAARELFESTEPGSARIALQALGDAYERYYSVINTDLRPCRQSTRSRCVEEGFAFDVLIERRRMNSRILYDHLASPTLSLVHATLPATVVPFCIPARVRPGTRARILDRLFEQGTMLSTLQDKWDFVPRHEGARYAVEAAFLQEHVLIPVSEFISAAAMRAMCTQLNEL